MDLHCHVPRIHKFGRNTDSDTGDDIWDGSAAYPFPAAAATTTVASGDANDTSDGTGARTIDVMGLDANYASVTESVTMNGTSNVTLSTSFLRVFRAYVTTVGRQQTLATFR